MFLFDLLLVDVVHLVYKFDTGRIGNESQADSIVGDQFDLSRRNGFIKEEIGEITVDYFIVNHRREFTVKLKKTAIFPVLSCLSYAPNSGG